MKNPDFNWYRPQWENMIKEDKYNVFRMLAEMGLASAIFKISKVTHVV